MLSDRVLNRTLLDRQHLLARSDTTPLAMTEHLLGLQAQDVLPPYLSLAARLHDFDPHDLSSALEDRSAVRLLLMRGTIHLVTAADAWALRPWVQPSLTRMARTADFGRGFPEDAYHQLASATREALADGPLSGRLLGERLTARFPELTPSRATALAKTLTPLVQLPPRGTWGASGGQTYLPLEEWVGGPASDPDPAEVVRRYLRAFGPATPADVTTWSGVTGMRSVFTAMGDELRRDRDERGRVLFDLAELSSAPADLPAPVRLLGVYDNLWLSHAERTRVTTAERRTAWQGANGGADATVFVDGMLEGLWRRTPSGAVDLRLLRSLTRAEQSDLAVEVGRVEQLLALP